jgi:hypothetical protein
MLLVNTEANFTCAFAAAYKNRIGANRTINFFIRVVLVAQFTGAFRLKPAAEKQVFVDIGLWPKQAGYRANNDYNQVAVNPQHVFMLIKVVLTQIDQNVFIST